MFVPKFIVYRRAGVFFSCSCVPMTPAGAPQRPNTAAFAQGVYDELDRLQQLDDKGTMTVEWPTAGQFNRHPRIVVNREACLRNLTWDYNLFAVTYDLNWAQKALKNAAGDVVQEKRTNAKGTMLFPDFDAFFAYYCSLPAQNRHFYHRNWADQPVPFVMDIDDLSKDEENNPWGFGCAGDLIDRLCDELNDFVGSCEDVGCMGMFSHDDFCVFVCDKWDKDQKEVWSLHLHHKGYWFENPESAKEFFRLFHDYLRKHANWPKDDIPMGIDLSIYNKYHSLRLPGCCKKERDPKTGQQIVRILQRWDRLDSHQEEVAESVRLALMVKKDRDMDLRVEVRLRAESERLPVRTRNSVELTDHNPSTYMFGIAEPELLKRMQFLLVQEAFPECPDNQMPQIMHQNEHRVVWRSDLPFHCEHCDRDHTGNTNFMLTTDKPYEDPTAKVVMKCFQRGCHPKKAEYSMVLGLAKCEIKNYTFSIKSCHALIQSASETAARVKQLTADVADFETQIRKLKRKIECLEDRGRDTTPAEVDLEDAEEKVGLAKADLDLARSELKEQQEVAIEYVDKFFKLIKKGEGGGSVFRLEFRHDPSDMEGQGIDQIVRFDNMGGANQFRKVTIHTQYDTLTYDPEDKKQNVFELWWVWDKRKDYGDLGYYPAGGKAARENPHHFNTFFGLSFDYDRTFLRDPKFQLGGWWQIAEKFFPNTLKVLCDRTEFGCDQGQNKQTFFLMWWIRCMLHTPGDTTPVMPILYGKQGSGKTLIARLIEELVGRHNSKTVTAIPDLFCHFNNHLTNAIYFVVSEIGQLNAMNKNPDHNSEQVLKDFLDGDGSRTKNITSKGKDSESKVVTMWLLGTSNYEKCVEVDPHERRKNPIDGDRLITPQVHFTRMLKEMSDRTILRIMFHWFWEMPAADTLGPEHAGANTNFFRDPANLPQTPYVHRLKELQKCTACMDDDCIKLFTECIMKFKGDLDQPNELLFHAPLISVSDRVDGQQYTVISERDLQPAGIPDFFVPAHQGTRLPPGVQRVSANHFDSPSYIRFPRAWAQNSLDFRGGKTVEDKFRQIEVVIKASINTDYREWYDAKCKQKVQNVAGGSVRCFIIPYGENGVELLRVANAVLGN